MRRLKFSQFRQVGKEQWYVQPNSIRKNYVRWCGPLGVNARIRNAHIINTFLKLKLSERANILDAGCGHAYALFWLAQQFPQYQFTGLELDPQLIRDNTIISQMLELENVQFFNNSLSDISEQAKYDVIYSMDVLEHIEDDIGVLQKFNQALRPGGYLLLHLPRRHQESRHILPVFNNYRTHDHVRDEYTVEEIRGKLSKTGFEICSVAYGYSTWGELAFETNYLFWDSIPLRTGTAILLHPFSVWLAYMETRHTHKNGNSFVIIAGVSKTMESNGE